MKTVSAAEAKANLAELLRRAERGEETVVTRSGVAVAKLVPLRPRAGGFLHGEVTILDDAWWASDDDLADDFGI